jgi:hypothetical protein
MLKVMADTNPFRKLILVSAMATPFSHSLAASTTEGGTSPKIKLWAQGLSITWFDGAFPVVILAW